MGAAEEGIASTQVELVWGVQRRGPCAFRDVTNIINTGTGDFSRCTNNFLKTTFLKISKKF